MPMGISDLECYIKIVIGGIDGEIKVLNIVHQDIILLKSLIVCQLQNKRIPIMCSAVSIGVGRNSGEATGKNQIPEL